MFRSILNSVARSVRTVAERRSFGALENRRSRQFVSGLVATVLALSALTFFTPATGTWAATSDSCNGSYSNNNLTVTASQGSVFYVDSASSQGVDASYIGYVVNGTNASNNLWVKVDTFAGGSVGLVDPSTSTQGIGAVSTGKKTAFFLVKAAFSTVRAQSHVVHVYDGNPALSSAVEKYSCTFSFSKVKETIAANPNKVTAVTTTPSTTSNLALGSTFTVTVTGDTGTIGSGSTPDNDMMWMSPVAKSSWPAGSLRLESSVVKFDNTAAGVDSCATEGTCMFTNQLLVTGLLAKANAIQNNSKSLAYKATYTFRVIGKTAASVPIIPISQISSGTQVKHTPIPTTALASLSTDQITVNASMTKSTNPSATVSGSTMTFGYKLTVQNSGTSAISVDQLIDAKDSQLSYKAASVSAATYPTSSGGSATSVTAFEPATNSSGQLVFPGPYTVPAGGRLELSYSMNATCASGSFSYTNGATAQIGSYTIGSGASTFSQVVATGTCGTTTVASTTSNQTIPPAVVTQNASSIANSSATLNGTVDPNGASGGTIEYLYGTDSALANPAVISAGTTTSGTDPYNVTGSLTGLSTGTIYYFRIRVSYTSGGSTTSNLGNILSFVTTEPVATPTITTDAATNVSGSTAVINGTIDPNQTASYVLFTVGTNSSLSSGNSTYWVRDDMTSLTNYNASTNTTFASSFPTSVSADLAALGFSFTANTTYYYRADIYTTAATPVFVSSGAIKSFKATTTAAQAITFNSIANQSFGGTSPTTAPTANSTLPVTVTTGSPSICSVTGTPGATYTINMLAAGDCTLIASQDGGTVGSTYYAAATQVIQTFNIAVASRTLSIDSGSYSATYSDWTTAAPTLTSTASAGNTDGTKTFAISGTNSICSINAMTGALTFLAPGTCTVTSTISVGSKYASATAAAVNIVASRAARTLTINSGSYASSYTDVTSTAPRLTSTASAGDTDGTKTFAVSGTSSVCSVDSVTGQVSFIAAGTCTVTSTISVGTSFNTATSSSVSFSVGYRSRTLAINSNSFANSYSDWTLASPTITSTASAGDTDGTKSFAVSGTSSICSVNASTGQVTFLAPGTCTITSAISAGSTYGTANASSVSFTASRASRTLAINSSSYAVSYIDWSSAAPRITSTASAGDSDGAKSFAISGTSSVCSIDASTGQVTFITAGTCTVVSSIATGTSYNSANSATVSFTIGRKTRSLSIDGSSFTSSYTDWSTAGPTLTSTATFGDADGTKSFAVSGTSSVCSVDSATGHVTFLTPGTCTVASTISQGSLYNLATSSTVSFTIGQKSQTLTMADSAHPVGDGTFALSATSNASTNATGLGSYVYSIDANQTSTSGCSVSAGVLSFSQAGTCYVAVSRTGNSFWTDGSTTAVITINSKLSRGLGIYQRSGGSNVAIPSSVSDWTASGITIVGVPDHTDTGDSLSYALDPSSTGCAIDASTGALTFTGAGTCKVVSAISQGNVYNNANSPVATITVGKKNQNITNFANASALATDLTADLSASSDATTNNSDLGPVTYSLDSANSDPGCSISGGKVHFTTAGNCVVTASRAGGANWNSASKTVTFTVSRANRTIDFDSTSYAVSQSYNDWQSLAPSLVGVPTAGSGDGSVSYSLDGASTGCSVDATTGAVTFTGAGTCKVVTSVAQGARYNSAHSTVLSLTIGKKTQHITNFADATVTATDLTADLNASSDATTNNSDIWPATYTIVSAGSDAGCSISAGKLHFTSGGSCVVTATRNAGTNWTNASSTVTYTVNRANRTIDFDSSTYAPSHAYANWSSATPTLTGVPTAGSGDGSVSYSLDVTSTGCSVNASTGAVTFTSAGTCKVVTSVAQGAKYNSAQSGVLSFTIGKKDQNITNFAGGTAEVPDGTISLGASSDATSLNSGITDVTYVIDAGSATGCAINSSNSLEFTQAGTCSVTAYRNGNSNWNSATQSVTFAISRANRAINFDSSSYDVSRNYPDWSLAGPTLSGVPTLGSTDGSISYSIDGASTVCSIDPTSGALTFTGPGVCNVITSVGQGTRYNAAHSATLSLTVGRAHRGVSINASSYSSFTGNWADNGPTLDSTATNDDNDGAKTYSVDSISASVCSVDANTGHITALSAGSCVVTVHIAQGIRYQAATSSQVTIPIARRPQSMSLSDASISVSSGSTSLAATSDANTLTVGLGAMTYQLDPGHSSTSGCAVSGATLSFTAQGDCWVKVTRAGNTHWLDGSTVAHYVINSKLSRTVRIKPNTEAASSYDPNGYTDWGTSAPTLASAVSSTDTGDVFTYTTESDSTGCSVNAGTGAVSFTGAGTCKVHVSVNEGPNYNGDQSSTVTFTIGRRTQHITNFNAATLTATAATFGLTAVSDASTNTTGMPAVSYSIGGGSTAGCSITSGSTLAFTQYGQCVVVAMRSGNGNWTDASSTVTYVVNRASRSAAITAANNVSGVTAPASVQLSSAPSQGAGALTWTAGPSSVCSINANGLLTVVAAGTCNISSSHAATGTHQQANAQYTLTVLAPAAPPVVTQVAPTPSAPVLTVPVPMAQPLAPQVVAPQTQTQAPTQAVISGIPLAEPIKTAAPQSKSALTIDAGAGASASEAATTPIAAALQDTATRSPSQLQTESVGGFKTGSSVQIQVSGSRTTAQFVLASGTAIDTVAIAATLIESQQRNATNFATINSAKQIASVPLSEVTSGKVTSDAQDLFKASGLGEPKTLGSLDLSNARHWVNVDATVKGYVPGSVVYLAVTTNPIIFGSAVVGDDGSVTLNGNLALDVLGAEAHSIRLIGTRDLGGVSVDGNGQLQLSDSTTAEIQKFDRGTNAVVVLNGTSERGGHTAVRLVPLRAEIPWWTLWVYLATILFAFAVRWRRPRGLASTITFAVGGFAMVLLPVIAGWVTMSYILFMPATGAFLVAVTGSVLLRFKRKRISIRGHGRFAN